MTPRFLAGVTRKLEFSFLELEKKLDKWVFLKGNEESGLGTSNASQWECWVGSSMRRSAFGARGWSWGYRLKRRCLIPWGWLRRPRSKHRFRRSLRPGLACFQFRRRRRNQQGSMRRTSHGGRRKRRGTMGPEAKTRNSFEKEAATTSAKDA